MTRLIGEVIIPKGGYMVDFITVVELKFIFGNCQSSFPALSSRFAAACEGLLRSDEPVSLSSSPHARPLKRAGALRAGSGRVAM